MVSTLDFEPAYVRRWGHRAANVRHTQCSARAAQSEEEEEEELLSPTTHTPEHKHIRRWTRWPSGRGDALLIHWPSARVGRNPILVEPGSTVV